MSDDTPTPFSSRYDDRGHVKTISVSQFKAQCLAVFDDVEKNHVEITVTRRGRPVARIVPFAPAQSLRGSVEFLVPDEETTAPIENAWKAS